MINLGTGFHIGSRDSVDDRLILTKEQMLNINLNIMPDVYMCVCRDDGAIYTFNIDNEVNDKTGKFRILSGSGDCYTKSEMDTILRPLLYKAPTLNISTEQTNYKAGDVVDITFNIGVLGGNEKITRICVSSWFNGEQEITNFSQGLTSTTVTFTGVSQTDVFNLVVQDEFKSNNKDLKITFGSLSYAMLVDGSSSFDVNNYTMDDLFTYSNTVENLPLESKEYKWYFGRSITKEHICYCYPKEYGVLETITDGGLNYISGFNMSEKTYNGVEYYCYVGSTPSTLTDYGSLHMEFK